MSFLLNHVYADNNHNCLVRNNRGSSNEAENYDYNIKSGKRCHILKSLELRPGKFIGFNNGKSCDFDSNTNIIEHYREGLVAVETVIKNGKNIKLSCETDYELANTTKNTVSCNDGVLNIAFLGCQSLGDIPAKIVFKAVAGDNTIKLKSEVDNDCVIDWGDNTATSACPNDGTATHRYAKAGDYNVTISGNRFWGFTSCDSSHTNKGIKKLISMGKWNNSITSMYYAFQHCMILEEISPDALKYLVNLTDLKGAFEDLPLIKSVSADLFKYNTEVTSISSTFYKNRLTSVPADLFKYNTKVRSFAGLFAQSTSLSSVPADLFKYNTEVTNFNDVFLNVPLTSVPADLFKHNTKVTGFIRVFAGCKQLKCSDIAAASVNWPNWNAEGVAMDNSTLDCKK
jgi:hypothetical protein